MRGPSTRSPDLLVTLNLLPRPLLEISSQELPTRLLHKTSMRNLGTKSPYISEFLARPLWKISWKELSISSLHKTSMRDLCTRPPEISWVSSQEPSTRSQSSLQDLLTRPLWEISISSLHKTSMRDLCTRALYKISSQDPHMRDLYTLYKISGYPWTS